MQHSLYWTIRCPKPPSINLMLKLLALAGPPTTWIALQVTEGASIIEELKESAPTLVALVTIVALMLRYIDQRDKRAAAREVERDRVFSATIREIHSTGKDVQHSATETLKETNIMLGRVEATLERLEKQ